MERPTDKEIIKVAQQELLQPNFVVTRQYLEVMHLEKSDGLPVVHRMKVKDEECFSEVYFSVKGEEFFVVVRVVFSDVLKADWVWIENGHRVYLSVYSDHLSHEELASSFEFTPTEVWTKGDLTKSGCSRYKSTCVSFEPIKNLAYSLEEKLTHLLACLSDDKEAVALEGGKNRAVIQVCRYQYVSGNAGINLSPGLISQLSQMNLELDIDMYCVGEEIK